MYPGMPSCLHTFADTFFQLEHPCSSPLIFKRQLKCSTVPQHPLVTAALGEPLFSFGP